jgi:hypothetical protein
MLLSPLVNSVVSYFHGLDIIFVVAVDVIESSLNLFA